MWAECANCGARSTQSEPEAGVIQRWNAEQDDKYGIYGKYLIAKADGTPVYPDAQYFVLRLDTDIHARRAIMAYAESVEIENGTLSSELRTWAVELEQAAGETPQEQAKCATCETCRHYGGAGYDGTTGAWDAACSCSELMADIYYPEPGFGCIHHERKVTK